MCVPRSKLPSWQHAPSSMPAVPATAASPCPSEPAGRPTRWRDRPGHGCHIEMRPLHELARLLGPVQVTSVPSTDTPPRRPHPRLNRTHIGPMLGKEVQDGRQRQEGQGQGSETEGEEAGKEKLAGKASPIRGKRLAGSARRADHAARDPHSRVGSGSGSRAFGCSLFMHRGHMLCVKADRGSEAMRTPGIRQLPA